MYNGSGNFNIQITLVPNTSALAEDINAIAQDIATGLSNALTRDGQSPAMADIPMGGHKITGLGIGDADTDAASLALLYNFVPAGTPLPYLGATLPAGFLFPIGQTVSRTTYSRLFAALSTRFNTGGEDATLFRLPDMRGVTFAGLDNMGGTAKNRLTNFASGGTILGAVGGEQAHAMTGAENGPHFHGVNESPHSHGNYDSGHAHTYFQSSNQNYGVQAGGQGPTNLGGGTQSTGAASANIVNAAAFTGITVQQSGSGTAHNNVQPTMIGNWIIKT